MSFDHTRSVVFTLLISRNHYVASITNHTVNLSFCSLLIILDIHSVQHDRSSCRLYCLFCISCSEHLHGIRNTTTITDLILSIFGVITRIVLMTNLSGQSTCWVA